MKKQMEYANRRGIPYVVIVGSQELEAGAATVKDMRTGEQRQVSLDKLATEIWQFIIENSGLQGCGSRPAGFCRKVGL